MGIASPAKAWARRLPRTFLLAGWMSVGSPMSMAVTRAAFASASTPSNWSCRSCAQAEFSRLRAALSEIGQLHDHHLHLRPELATPASEQFAQLLVIVRLPDIGFALIPGGPCQTHRAKRGNHGVVHHAKPGIGIPWRARRDAGHAGNRIFPIGPERHLFAAARRDRRAALARRKTRRCPTYCWPRSGFRSRPRADTRPARRYVRSTPQPKV